MAGQRRSRKWRCDMGAIKEKYLNNIPADEELYPVGIDDEPDWDLLYEEWRDNQRMKEETDEEGDKMERYFSMNNKGRRTSHGIRRIWKRAVDTARRIFQK
jgi:hypothetical protein